METSRKVAVLGVTGMIGRGLPERLAEMGFATTGVSRSAGLHLPGVSAWQTLDGMNLAGHHAVINLTGAPIDQRWTAANRRLFHESRVGVTRKIVDAIRVLPQDQRPRVLVNGSAVGVYGDRGDELLNETSRRGDGYLADLCVEWEQAANEAQALGVRVVCLRTGVVLGRGGEAFERMRRLFSLGLGGRLGDGRQWMPWIHVEDIRGAIVQALVSERLNGPVNGVAPSPERNVEFTRKFAKALHRPAVLPVPGIALKLAFGGFGGVLLAGQRVAPEALQRDGYVFRYPTLEQAFGELVGHSD